MTNPEDILPDGVDSTVLNGKMVRKGTIAAFFFLANIEIYESPTATDIEKNDAKKMLLSLAPSVIAIGLHKFVTVNYSPINGQASGTKQPHV